MAPMSLQKTVGKDPFANLKQIMASHAAYVGIPASVAGRQTAIAKMAGNIKATTAKQRKRKKRLLSIASAQVTNAELLWLHSKGSMMRHIPARPVIEPAIAAKGNREPIAREIANASKAAMHGDQRGMMTGLKRAGIAGQNASRKWFTDSRNHWAPNSPRTIAQKGSDRPLIDTGALRASIVYVVK